MTTSADTTSPWLVARGSVIGQGHVKHGLPCQDDNSWQVLADNPAWGVAVVSDGAGSCANSDKGSTRIVAKAGELFSELIRQQGWAESVTLPDAATWTDLARATLKQVASDLRFYAESQSLDFHSLSATIIVVVFGPMGLLVANVGDGRAAAQRTDGSWHAIMTPYRGEEVNATVFLTSNIWAADRVDQFVGAEVYPGEFRAFALLSDGCEMATFALSRFDEVANRYEALNEPHPPFFNPNVAALVGLHKQGKTEDEINQLWKRLLTNGTQRLADEPDDKTIILAVNLALADVALSTPPVAQVTPLESQPVTTAVEADPVAADTPASVQPTDKSTVLAAAFRALEPIRNIVVKHNNRSEPKQAGKKKKKKGRR